MKALISGVGITTLGFPPYFGNFASISPNVLETYHLELRNSIQKAQLLRRDDQGRHDEGLIKIASEA